MAVASTISRALSWPMIVGHKSKWMKNERGQTLINEFSLSCVTIVIRICEAFRSDDAPPTHMYCIIDKLKTRRIIGYTCIRI